MAKFKVVRKITYESDELAVLQLQLLKSVRVGTHDWATRVTVEHLEGPQWTMDGAENFHAGESKGEPDVQ